MSMAVGVWSVLTMEKVVDAVHNRGSFIFLQIVAVGRMASPAVLEKEGPYPLVSPTDSIPTGGSIAPTPLTIDGAYRILFTRETFEI